MSEAYNIYVFVLQLIFTSYLIYLLCNYHKFFSKQTWFVLVYLASSYYLVYGIRVFLWATLAHKEVNEESNNFFMKVNSLREPIEYIYILQYGYIIFLLSKALCIITATSLEDLNEKLTYTLRKNRMITQLYFSISLPCLTLFMYFSLSTSISFNWFNAILMFTFYIFFILDTILWYWIAYYSFGICSRILRTITSNKKKIAVARISLAVCLVLFITSDLVTKLLFPVRHCEILDEYF